ncbi:probable prefoldin subunit 4 [Cylas formicarius]|uniref:probable prefoldin subunit 4 n=1 Tax=Cylas formicarius TaxID=197179 RepID=UPI0029583462|nr:probable prefoldin subunit 4 [Cylas formicarius]
MASNTNKGTFQPDSDVHITYEDQQKINIFARLNAKLEDLKDEVKAKENDLKSLEDASDEIELLDEDEPVPYLIGEVFVFQDLGTTQKCLEEAKEKLTEEMNELKIKADDVKEKMSELKGHLYGKFGSHINLEADE